MNRQEFALFASALRTYYSRENLLPNAQAMDLWFRALADIPYDSACVMLDKWVMLNKWSPSISEIREQCAEMTEEPRRDWSEGWADVLAAVRAFGWAREAEAIARLDPVTAETVRRIGWMNICASENLSIERASFRTIYETMDKRQREEKQLPQSLKSVIAGIGLKAIGGKRE